MHAEELNLLLKVLRGAPELANVSYVCAFKDAVARIVSPKDVTFGLRYLETFLPVQLQLPAIESCRHRKDPRPADYDNNRACHRVTCAALPL
jgi:hypothetical protein